MDFTLKRYQKFIDSIKQSSYEIKTFDKFIRENTGKIIVLRHDVDRRPDNALRMAEIENNAGVRATYYFRSIPSVFSEKIMRKIISLDHELGYHYEDLDLNKGDATKAIESFKYNLERFRKIYPVSTICMHGSPLSRWDNRSLWDAYDYKQYNITAEPYFDVNYKEVLYITDTGRHWNNENISIRDKVNSPFTFSFRNSKIIMNGLSDGTLPDKIIINSHPHRWFNNPVLWTKELLMQNLKNQVKAFLIKQNKNE